MIMRASEPPTKYWRSGLSWSLFDSITAILSAQHAGIARVLAPRIARAPALMRRVRAAINPRIVRPAFMLRAAAPIRDKRTDDGR